MSLNKPSTGNNIINLHGEDFLPKFLEIMDCWEIDDATACDLLRISQTTMKRYKSNPSNNPWDRDQLERLSNIFAIHHILTYILGSRDGVKRWLNTPQGDAVFGGESPIRRILAGQIADLLEVRRWLEARLDLMT